MLLNNKKYAYFTYQGSYAKIYENVVVLSGNGLVIDPYVIKQKREIFSFFVMPAIISIGD